MIMVSEFLNFLCAVKVDIKLNQAI